MRTLFVASSAVIAMLCAGQADARQASGGWSSPRPANPGGWSGPRPSVPSRPGGWSGPRPSHPMPTRPGGWNGPRPIGGNTCLGGCAHRPRWGGRISGRWWAGMRAPGGWGAYRRPARGWVLPSYWISPAYYISDYGSYGLSAPPYGYNWSRYYDDAVLIDDRGSVYDSVGGIGWDRYDGPDFDYGYQEGAWSGYAGDGYETRDADGGLGGAAVGAVVGGVAGNIAAGRGDRLAGTLIGAGVGAVAGAAIDRSDRRGRVPVAPGTPYPAPGVRHAPPPAGGPVVAYQQGRYGGDYAGTSYSGVTTYAPAPYAPPAPTRTVLADGTVVTTTSTQGSPGYVAGGWYYPGQTLTTVTVTQGAATTREVVEYVEKRRAPVRYRRVADKRIRYSK